MTLTEIEEQIKNGELKLNKAEYGTFSRLISVRSKERGEYYDVGHFSSDGNWKGRQMWHGEFIRYERKTYPKVIYLAQDKDGGTYKISKKLYTKYFIHTPLTQETD
jgi:hypothetical protein